MQILLSSNKGIIKEYIKEDSIIGFIPTASELDDDRWYMEKDKEDLSKMNYNVLIIDISKESKEEILEKFNNIDAIFIAGGNSFYLLQQLKIKNVFFRMKKESVFWKLYDMWILLFRKKIGSRKHRILNCIKLMRWLWEMIGKVSLIN